jgi:hypothetical protein
VHQVLARPPRGNTVCEHHGLGRKQLARVQFAELVQVGDMRRMPGCRVQLSTFVALQTLFGPCI